MVFDGLFELAIVWLMASGIFVSKLIEGGTKFLIVVSVRFQLIKYPILIINETKNNGTFVYKKKQIQLYFFIEIFALSSVARVLVTLLS